MTDPITEKPISGDLTTMTTPELMNALCARFDYAVFAGMAKDATGKYVEYKQRKGHIRTCQGLCVALLIGIEPPT